MIILKEDVPIRYFNNYIYNNQNLYYTVKDLKPYLPKIKHFKKRGHLCASQCGSECTYCRKCADRMQKALVMKNEQERVKIQSICVMNKSSEIS